MSAIGQWMIMAALVILSFIAAATVEAASPFGGGGQVGAERDGSGGGQWKEGGGLDLTLSIEPKPPTLYQPQVDDVSRSDEVGTWIQHGAIAAAIVGGVSATAGPQVLAPAAVLTCAGFIFRELNGPGDLFGYPDDYTGPYSDTDRIMDWAVPCATAGLIWYWRKDKPPIVPWFTPDGGGIGYVGSFD